MILYKDVFAKLREAGWTIYKLQREKILPNSVITRIQRGGTVTTATIDTICRLLDCQPGDIIEYKPDEEERS